MTKTKERTYQVKRRTSLEPLNLSLIERVRKGDLLRSPVLMLDSERQVLAGGERLEAEDRHLIVRLNPVVVLGVGERQRKHTLLLQVRLVDTRERAGDDRKATEETRLERSVLTRGALTVVVVADDDPLDTAVTVVSADLRDASVLAGKLVLDLVGLAVLDVNGTDQAVLCCDDKTA